jgi:hypothetical protein
MTHEDAVKKDINAFKDLARLNQNGEFDKFVDLLIKTAADKMIWAFVGDNVKSYEDFLKVRGEITAYLFPIQEVRGANAMAKQLTEHLTEYYGSEQAR